MEEEVPKNKKRVMRKKINSEIAQTINSDSYNDTGLKNAEKSVAEMDYREEETKSIKKRLSLIFYSYFLTYKSLSTEKIFFFWVSFILGVVFIVVGLNKLSSRYLVEIPTFGGTLKEGVVGVSRYVNPVLASSDTDKDLSRLVYSGLVKKDTGGELVNDLANNIEESEDNLTFTVTIKENAKFHDGEKVRSEDVIFTLSKIQDKNINSPLAIDFEGVEAESLDENTVVFHLKRPYIHFRESLTFGILPKHLWNNVSQEEFSLSDKNINPIGSGPYEVRRVVKDGSLAKRYELVSYKKYVNGRPYIDNVEISVYQNEKDLFSAFKKGDIDSTAYLNPNSLEKLGTEKENILVSELPNLFSLSFNPIKNKDLSNSFIRSSLEMAINKDELISKIFFGYSKKVNFGNEVKTLENTNLTKEDLKNELTLTPESTVSKIEIAKALLEKTIKDQKLSGLEDFTINITTADVEELKIVAEQVANYWRGLGINVNINIYSISDIADIIKNRNFEVLLFGSIIEHDTDLYAYWHSSQRSYPGLNITNYSSKNMDKNLEILKTSLDKEERFNATENIN
ncbi:MAG: hypothetical protein RI945_37, partial [Candidatus Parcubacteria bacterium]